MSRAKTDPFDRELADLPQALRWRTWMLRIEAVLFASASPVSRTDLAKVVGQGVNIDLLLADLHADLDGRSFEIARVGDAWTLHTRPTHAAAIRAAALGATTGPDLSQAELGVLAAIAWHQPVTRDGLKDIFGKTVSRDLITRLRSHNLIATGPRAPRTGAPHTYVTTDRFLETFDLETLQDLPEPEENG